MPADLIMIHPPESSNAHPGSYNKRTLPLIVAFVLLAFFLAGFFAVYLFHYVMHLLCLTSWSRGRNFLTGTRFSRTSSPRGLDPVVVSSFPTFSYASVKHHRRGPSTLECAICLSEFSDEDVLRLLRGCYHVFHQVCIDTWLERHTTCPVCRCELGFICKTNDFFTPFQDLGDVCERSESEGAAKEDERRFPNRVCLERSNSTGHSVVDVHDRFTLRLPEDVVHRRCCTRVDQLSPDLERGLHPCSLDAPVSSVPSSTTV